MGIADISPGIKRSGREADHTHDLSAEFKNKCSYTYTPSHVFHDRPGVNFIVCFMDMNNSGSKDTVHPRKDHEGPEGE